MGKEREIFWKGVSFFLPPPNVLFSGKNFWRIGGGHKIKTRLLENPEALVKFGFFFSRVSKRTKRFGVYLLTRFLFLKTIFRASLFWGGGEFFSVRFSPGGAPNFPNLFGVLGEKGGQSFFSTQTTNFPFGGGRGNFFRFKINH